MTTDDTHAATPRRPPWWLWLVLLLAVVIGGIAAAYALTGSDSSSAKKNPTNVTSTAARGRSTLEVPNVVGLSDSQALTRLQAVGLKGRNVPVASSEPKGRVLKQAPPGGTEAKKRSVVMLGVSNGTSLVPVPSVQGQTQAHARTTLRRLGFKVVATSVAATQPKGTVVSQQPAAGTREPKGSTVRLNVSNGPVLPPRTHQIGTVPDVVGKSQRRAVAILESAGYQVDSSPVASTRPRGTVLSQVPPAGTKAPERSRVRIGVSLGSGSRALRTVPDVTGQAERTARRALILAGFTVRTADKPVTKPSDNGIVLGQKPAAGKRAPVGTQIVIDVGRLPSPTD